MKANLRKHCRRNIFAVSIVLGLMAMSVSAVYAIAANPHVLPPHAKPYGMTYEEWSAKYWQWVVSLRVYGENTDDPTVVHPFLDADGDCSNGAKGQFGPVWFLAGMPYGWEDVERDCTVPTGKALFFPVISFMEASFLSQTEEDLRANAASLMEQVLAVEADIDGVPVQDLMEDYHFLSPVFTVGPLPVWNWFGSPVGSSIEPTVADGVYLMLAPLSKGRHTIHFAWMDSSWHDITYYLNVVKE